MRISDWSSDVCSSDLCTLFFPAMLDGHRSLVAFAGAGAAAILVFLLGWRRGFEPITMVVSGLLIGVTAGALSAALTLAQGEYLLSLVTWTRGSLRPPAWSAARAPGGERPLGPRPEE